MERALATLKVIDKLYPIENADNIELATMVDSGWRVVVKKGEFQPGELCIYCEIDSILPPKEEFAFLKDKNYRIRTIKLRGQISQGIIFPLSILPKMDGFVLKPGVDVTDILGITLYEEETKINGEAKGGFPSFIPKTDQPRIQNIPNFLDKYASNIVVITEKLDGTSSTYYINNNEFGVCSRNLELKESNSLYWQIAKKYDIENKLRDLNRNLAIQGEIIGPGIQKNVYQRISPELRLFDIYDIDKQRYIEWNEFVNIAKRLAIPTAPIISEDKSINDIAQNADKLEAILQFADGKSAIQSSQYREGIVIKCKEETIDPHEGRVSFKVISNQYLLNQK
jgi:RNA ligase (TIGR02306 family)